MVFSSMTFIFTFICLTVLLYFPIKNRAWRNGVLLVASLVFYSWGEPKFVIMMILSSLIAYLGGVLMKKESMQNYSKAIYVICLVLITANLLVFKYTNFFAENIETLFNVSLGIKEIALPIGISFYTFQILSYVIDLYHDRVGLQKNFAYLLLYVSFFPQLIAGPIVRYSTVENEINHRQENLVDAAVGVRRFSIGLAKKVLLSNGLAKLAEIIYAGDTAVFGSGMYWIAAVSYALQIYFDFSGYSDMAIGLGRIFGFHFLENFNHPYISLSVTDFWRRWHISLSSWFRDYIYIPLGGNRVSTAKWIRNILIVWILTGFWHGASWNFVLWGLYYAVFLLFEKLCFGKVLDKLPKFISWIYTAFIVVIGWVIFNLTDFAQMSRALSMMFSFAPSDFGRIITLDSEILTMFIYIPLGIIFMLPVSKLDIKKLIKNDLINDIILNVGSLLLLVLCVVVLLSTKFNPFIYFRF